MLMHYFKKISLEGSFFQHPTFSIIKLHLFLFLSQICFLINYIFFIEQFILFQMQKNPLGLENFPIKIPNFLIFSLSLKKIISSWANKNTWVKAGSAPFLLQIKTMLRSWRVGAFVKKFSVMFAYNLKFYTNIFFINALWVLRCYQLSKSKC